MISGAFGTRVNTIMVTLFTYLFIAILTSKIGSMLLTDQLVVLYLTDDDVTNTALPYVLRPQ
jgi:hypothetical protein